MAKNPYSDPLYRKNRAIVLKVSGYVCTYCGSPNANTADHIVPIAKGGTHDLSNLVACCLSCNSTKQDRTRVRLNWKNPTYL